MALEAKRKNCRLMLYYPILPAWLSTEPTIGAAASCLPFSKVRFFSRKEPRIANLEPPAHLKGNLQQQNLALLEQLNLRHLALHPGEEDLEARIANYELAAKMQSAAKDALDLSQETKATQRLYGLDQPHTREYGTRCLIARRLVERGVRFVQIFLHFQPWDHHSRLFTDLPAMCQSTDQPSAALVADLKARGLLDSTIVHWGGEIGRLPVSEGNFDSQVGRDHNGQGFSIWLAGGGFRGGMAFGQTDEFGHKAVENIVTPNDYQATVLHQFGIDHQKLVYQHAGREQSSSRWSSGTRGSRGARLGTRDNALLEDSMR